MTWDMKDWGAEKWLKEGVGLPEGALEDLTNNMTRFILALWAILESRTWPAARFYWACDSDWTYT